MEYKKVFEWSREELANGNRIKASKLNKIALKMQELFWQGYKSYDTDNIIEYIDI